MSAAAPHDRRGPARHRAGDVRALRADPRLAGRPRRRPRDAAGDPGARLAPARRALAGDGELADRARARRRRDRPARLPAPALRCSRERLLPIAAHTQRRPRKRVPGARPERDAASGGRRLARDEARGIEPRGFVAPGYAYTPALKRTLGERFHWWAALLGLHRAHPASAGSYRAHPGGAGVAAEAERALLGPPIALSSAGRLRRALSPALLRAGALISGTTLRLDLHPSDLEHPNHMLALEWVLKRSACTREAVTYEQLAAAATS